LYTAHAYGELNEPLERARYIWNFGNGVTTEGENVLHHYDYPGEYVVFLTVSNIDVTKLSGTDRMIVTALPAKIRIIEATPEFVTLENYDDRELDLSFWIIQSNVGSFTLPENTIVLAGGILILSYDVARLGIHDLSILYPNGESASTYTPIVKRTVLPPPVVIAPVVVEKVIIEEDPVSMQPASVILAKNEKSSSNWFIALISTKATM